MSRNFNTEDIAHHLGNIEGKLDNFIASLKSLNDRVERSEKELNDFKHQSLELHNETRGYTHKEISKLKVFQAKMGAYVALFLTGLTLILSSSLPMVLKKLFS